MAAGCVIQMYVASWIGNLTAPRKIQQRNLLPEELVDTLRDASEGDDRREDGMELDLPDKFETVLHICEAVVSVANPKYAFTEPSPSV